MPLLLIKPSLIFVLVSIFVNLSNAGCPHQIHNSAVDGLQFGNALNVSDIVFQLEQEKPGNDFVTFRSNCFDDCFARIDCAALYLFVNSSHYGCNALAKILDPIPATTLTENYSESWGGFAFENINCVSRSVCPFRVLVSKGVSGSSETNLEFEAVHNHTSILFKEYISSEVTTFSTSNFRTSCASACARQRGCVAFHILETSPRFTCTWLSYIGSSVKTSDVSESWRIGNNFIQIKHLCVFIIIYYSFVLQVLAIE
jgi:hypothetical protein